MFDFFQVMNGFDVIWEEMARMWNMEQKQKPKLFYKSQKQAHDSKKYFTFVTEMVALLRKL